MADDEPEAKRRRITTPYISDLLRHPPLAVGIRHYMAPPPDPLLGPDGPWRNRRRRRDSWRDIPVSVNVSPASPLIGSSFQHPLDLDPDMPPPATTAQPVAVTTASSPSAPPPVVPRVAPSVLDQIRRELDEVKYHAQMAASMEASFVQEQVERVREAQDRQLQTVRQLRLQPLIEAEEAAIEQLDILRDIYRRRHDQVQDPLNEPRVAGLLPTSELYRLTRLSDYESQLYIRRLRDLTTQRVTHQTNIADLREFIRTGRDSAADRFLQRAEHEPRLRRTLFALRDPALTPPSAAPDADA